MRLDQRSRRHQRSADNPQGRLVSYDDEDDAGKALLHRRNAALENDVKFIMMLGGDSWPGVEEIAARQRA